MAQRLDLLPISAARELASAILDISRVSDGDEEQLRLAVAAQTHPQACAAGRCKGPGHDTPSPAPLLEIEGKKYHQWPLHLIRPDTWRVMSAIMMLEDYHLPPSAAGSLDQSAAFSQALGIVRRERAPREG